MSQPFRLCALACGVVLLMLGHLLWTVTGGLEHWTFESLRRSQAQRGELWAAEVSLRDSADRLFHPWGGGAAEGTPDVLIVDFIFTRCPTVCQALGSTFQQLQAQVHAGSQRTAGEDARIGLLSISFDTTNDDAAALAAYGRVHRARADLWRVAAPLDAAATQRLLRSLGVVVIADGLGGYAHNAGLHLVHRDGRLLAIHDQGEWRRALDDARHAVRDAAP
jgi:protein SCO1